MKPEVQEIVEVIQSKYQDIDTILSFGSALTSDWTPESDIDIFLIDDRYNDSRSELIINGISIEIQEDNFSNILKDIKSEYGQLLNRNVSNMIATANILHTKSQNRIANLIKEAKRVLNSKVEYSEEDLKMWKYSIKDYLSKAEKDITKNDKVAFYIHSNYVIQNALNMSLALNNIYMPQPKHLAKLLKKADPELYGIMENFLTEASLAQKMFILKKLETRCK